MLAHQDLLKPQGVSTASMLEELGPVRETHLSSIVQIKLRYFDNAALSTAINHLKEEEHTSKVLDKFPNEMHAMHIYWYGPWELNANIVMDVASIPMGQRFIHLSIDELVALIKIFNERININYDTNSKTKLSLEDELMFAQAKAYLMQKVLLQLSSESPKKIEQIEEVKIPLNYIQTKTEELKGFIIKNLTPLLAALGLSNTDVKNSNVDNSNSYKQWVCFLLVMAFHFIPIIYTSAYFATESMESLGPFLYFVTPHTMAALGILCTINALWGMLCFMGPMIMEWFEVHFSDKGPTLQSVYKEQLIAAKGIDKHLRYANTLSADRYGEYLRFSESIGDIPCQLKAESTMTTLLTCTMTSLSAVEAFSSSIMTGATLLGLMMGAFTFSTLTPPMLVAYVASHLWGTFMMSAPIAISQCIVHYISRVTSASKLLDPEKAESELVENMRINYKSEKGGIINSIKQTLLARKTIEQSQRDVNISTTSETDENDKSSTQSPSSHEVTSSLRAL